MTDVDNDGGICIIESTMELLTDELLLRMTAPTLVNETVCGEKSHHLRFHPLSFAISSLKAFISLIVCSQ